MCKRDEALVSERINLIANTTVKIQTLLSIFPRLYELIRLLLLYKVRLVYPLRMTKFLSV